MSGQGNNQLEANITGWLGLLDQSVDIPMSRVKSQLECPVCFNIPRELPIPSCPSGHIVCRPCKKRVTECPTCRQPMPANMTNSLAGALIEQVQHKCKFGDQGCNVKMMLKELQVHEKNCPERTIRCPYNTCGSIVKVMDFNNHAIMLSGELNRHSILRNTHHTFIIKRNDSWYTHKWKMYCISFNDEFFHLRLAYHPPENCFALSVWSSVAHVSEYRTNLSVKGNDKEIIMKGLLITSVEHVPSIDECIDENGKYFWCIPWTLAENFIVKSANEIDIDSRDFVRFSRLNVEVEIVKN